MVFTIWTAWLSTLFSSNEPLVVNHIDCSEGAKVAKVNVDEVFTDASYTPTTNTFTFGHPFFSHVSNYITSNELLFLIGLTTLTMIIYLAYYGGLVTGLLQHYSSRSRAFKNTISISLYFMKADDDGKKEQENEVVTVVENNNNPQVALSVDVEAAAGGDAGGDDAKPSGMSPPPAYEAVVVVEEDDSEFSSSYDESSDYDDSTDEDSTEEEDESDEEDSSTVYEPLNEDEPVYEHIV